MDSHREKKTPRSAREAAAESGLVLEKERVEGDLKRLKTKTRALLAQYEKKKAVIAAQVQKVAAFLKKLKLMINSGSRTFLSDSK